MKYRSDIDGLRAIAVLMVLFYHVGFSIISGGFIGVDVFFVISGYLITGIIYREIQAGSFTFVHFYTRRIKRILPAFYLVAFATLFAGYFLLLPSDYLNLSKSFLAASTFFANVFFWLESGGYFSGAADEMPLLHTWSLSVEEQFYFIWPVIILLACKFFSKRGLSILIILTAAVSFTLAEILSRQLSVIISSASYFLLPTKAGELLLGSLLAIYPHVGRGLNKIYANIISITGLLFIVLPSFILTKESVFPGIYSFIPCLGTALIISIGSSHQTVVHKILSLKPLIWVGLISYSLYLWHWPIVAYARYLQYDFTVIFGASICLLSIALAYLSWRFVEKPTRYAKGFGLVAMRYLVAPLAGCLLVVIVINQLDGFSGRLDGNIKFSEVKNSIKGPSVENGWCHDNKDDYSSCMIGAKNGQIRAALWGDSHGGTYSPFVDVLAKELGVSVTPLTYSSCTPFIVDKGNGANVDLCRKSREYMIESLENGDFDLIFIAARVDTILRSFRLNIDDYFDAIEFASKHAKKVIVLGQIPVFESNMASIKLRQTFLRGKINSGKVLVEANDWVERANASLREFTQAFKNVDMIDITDLFGVNALYSPVRDGVLLYSDTNHLNIVGAQHLAHQFTQSKFGAEYMGDLRRQLSIGY